MEHALGNPTVEQLNGWFKTLDKDGSGKIDTKELRVFVQKVYEWMKRDVGQAKIDADTAVCIYLL